MSFFATEYTIHFDDTMAYGSHHFLTAFKFQCAVRETYLFGEHIFDLPGVPEALEGIHLFTSDAYSRNLNPLILGDRVTILQTLEDWGRASVRFCYRAISEKGTPICAGFQMMICADAKTGNVIPVPEPLWNAMRSIPEIEEPAAEKSFRDRALIGGEELESLFGQREIQTATQYLKERYPKPGVIGAAVPDLSLDRTSSPSGPPENTTQPIDSQQFEIQAGDANRLSGVSNGVWNSVSNSTPETETVAAWVFAGQGAFDAELLSDRVRDYRARGFGDELDACARVTRELLGDDATSLVAGSAVDCHSAVEACPRLLQVAIHLQNVLGGVLLAKHKQAPDVLMGHSFGEIAALGVSGCFDLPMGVQIVCQRVLAIEQHAPSDGALLLALTDRETCATETALSGLDKVVVAGRNSQRQTVLSGPRQQLEIIKQGLQGIGVSALPISSPTCFHHPMLREAAAAWQNSMRDIQFQEPQMPVYSPIGRRFVPPQDDIAARLASQLVRPFDLAGSLDDLIGNGVIRFVDCGSRGSLAKILAATVGESETVVVSTAGDLVSRASVAGVAQATPPLPVESRSNPSAKKNGRPNHQLVQTPQVAKSLRPRVGIVGMGCLLPGGASSPDELFNAIMQRRLGIVDQRTFDSNWESDFYSEERTSDRSTSFLTGRVNDQDIVPPPGVSASLFASFTRPQQLLCIALAPCVAAIGDAERVMCLVGSTADGFVDQDVTTSLHYAGLDPSSSEMSGLVELQKSATQRPHDAIQEVFDKIVRPGLEITLVDAACASSLYTVALGTTALELNETDVVLAGGVFCPGPGNSCLFSQFNGTTATGCRPFDQNADGVVFSEGAAFVVLRRAADADQLGLPIEAMVRGVGLSSDGRSSSANVPQTAGQLLSLQRCYKEYQIDPASIHAVEAHGTSTPVGDSTELRTLAQFYENQINGPLPVHSLKGLLGHAGWAAGTASMIAVCQYMRNGVFPSQAFHQTESKALQESADTLYVAKNPVELPAEERRVAIDGFGFGGANGHVVLETANASSQRAPLSPMPASEELVIVGFNEISPNQDGRFDRNEMVEGHLMLPDLADDMDISQKLAIRLVDNTVSQLKSLDADDHNQIGIVLALTGKSERGVEATMRVLETRFRRQLGANRRSVEKLDAAMQQSRPSGAYTLQCMMPNVASGRAALQLDLKGPNFVVDSGPNSFQSSLKAASLLLRAGVESGSKLIVVASIDANETQSDGQSSEFAGALALTTKSFATARGLEVVGRLSDIDAVLTKSEPNDGQQNGGRQSERVLRHLQNGHTSNGLAPAVSVNGDHADDSSAAPSSSTTPEPTDTEPSKFPIHEPVWVESPVRSQQPIEHQRLKAVLCIVSSGSKQIDELASHLDAISERSLLCIVHDPSTPTATQMNGGQALTVDMGDPASIENGLSKIAQFSPDVVLATQFIESWKTDRVLSAMNASNGVCEMLFLTAQSQVDRLNDKQLELWGIVPGGWSGVVHPQTGPLVGFAKAVQREIPTSRMCVLSTRDGSIKHAIERFRQERGSDQPETEVVYDGSKRLVRRLRPLAPACKSPAAQGSKLNRDSVILATGGARGVTAVLLDAILQDHGCTVIAVGRSELQAPQFHGTKEEIETQFYQAYVRENPGVSVVEMRKRYESTLARWEAWQTMEQFSKLGRAEYLQADLGDADAVNRVVAEVVKKYGKIDLVMHGAGVQFSKRLEDRSLEDFRLVYGVKVTGLHNIVSACQRELGRTVDAHVLTSAYSVFGNDGQHDYGAANETLDRLCGLSTVHSDHDWASTSWLAWDGIGMTRGSEYKALAKQRGLSAIDFEAGQRIFREALAAGSPINVPLSESEHLAYAVPTVPEFTTEGRAVATCRVIEQPVRLMEIDCLEFHKVRGTPTLPGAWSVDRMVEAAMLLGGEAQKTIVTLEDIQFRRFVRFAWGFEPKLRVVVVETLDGIKAKLVGDVLMPNGESCEKDVVFAEANIRFDEESSVLDPSLHDIDHFSSSRCIDRDPYCKGRPDLDLSGPFDCLREIEIGQSNRTALFDLGASSASASAIDTFVPALLLDASLRLSAMHATADDDTICVPVSIRRVVMRTGSSLNGGCAVRSRNPTVQQSNVHCPRTELRDQHGVVHIAVDELLGQLT
jgi:3-oxoacyl-(acyl-carrier-protein) synthase/NAD(P)-dependent dehydrogenase (short-subunit alcohol dehydrogenase family)/acyl-CoA thioesterase FadM